LAAFGFVPSGANVPPPTQPGPWKQGRQGCDFAYRREAARLLPAPERPQAADHEADTL